MNPESEQNRDMNRSWRIVIAEDHTILREGLRALLASDPEFDVVGEAEDGFEAINCVRRLSPDVVLMDLSMPKMTGMEAVREIKRIAPETKVLVLTVHKNEEYILASFQAGSDGYVLKDASHHELTSAIKTVLKGKTYLCPAVSAVVLDRYLDGKKSLKRESSWNTLTAREREVLKLIAEGYKNKQIADLLCVSAKTVEKHRANLMKKLDLHSVPALTTLAIEKGLIWKSQEL
ncbi:MAG TPA: response regulator transcription factor [Desulfomonilaceae bacterium]|nr:response regulator transcription factor [Desulfomonilaceae bacterium]